VGEWRIESRRKEKERKKKEGGEGRKKAGNRIQHGVENARKERDVSERTKP